MNNYIIAFIGISIFVFAGCSKDESVNNPTLMDYIEIDIDEDRITDYKIVYSQYIIDVSTLSNSADGIGVSIIPYGKNQILKHEQNGSLFLRDLAQIENHVEEPLFWRNRLSSSIVSIHTLNSGDWPNKWTINSDTEHSTYFLGLKVVSDNEINLGWVEIEINTNDGSVSIVDKGIL